MLLPTCIPVRYVFTVLAFVGFVFNYTLRININMVITSMVNHTALNDIDDYKLNSTKKDVSTYRLKIFLNLLKIRTAPLCGTV